MADAGTYGHTMVPSEPSWSAAGAEVLAAELVAIEPRELEHGERVMVCYRSGLSLPGSACIMPTSEPGMVLVLVELYAPHRAAYGWWPRTMLRTLVHEQCVPAGLVG